MTIQATKKMLAKMNGVQVDGDVAICGNEATASKVGEAAGKFFRSVVRYDCGAWGVLLSKSANAETAALVAANID